MKLSLSYAQIRTSMLFFLGSGVLAPSLCCISFSSCKSVDSLEGRLNLSFEQLPSLVARQPDCTLDTRHRLRDASYKCKRSWPQGCNPAPYYIAPSMPIDPYRPHSKIWRQAHKCLSFCSLACFNLSFAFSKDAHFQSHYKCE